MTWNQGVKKLTKEFRAIYLLCTFLMLSGLTGCGYRYNTLWDYQMSVQQRMYGQAAIRLDRCASYGSQSEQCNDILNKLKKTGLPLPEAIRQDHEASLRAKEQEKKTAYFNSLRRSTNPWDQMLLVAEIQKGGLKEDYPKEIDTLIEKAFFGFGECAKQADPPCMTQYGQMIMYGMDALSDDKKQSARQKALYWLNLSARYGNEDARRLLLTLEENIPSPDLSMESLQKAANSIAKDDIKARKEAERRQAYYNSEMLREIKRANYIASMNSFFPRTVNCTANNMGVYTYINCR